MPNETQYSDFRYLIDKLIELQEKNLENDRKLKEHLLSIKLKLETTDKKNDDIQEELKEISSLISDKQCASDTNLLKSIEDSKKSIIEYLTEIKDLYQTIKKVMVAIGITIPIIVAIAEFIMGMIK